MNRARWLHLALVAAACLLSALLQAALILDEPETRVVIELGRLVAEPAPIGPAGGRT